MKTENWEIRHPQPGLFKEMPENITISSDGAHLATVHCGQVFEGGNLVPSPRAHEVANLIAAAPDLLECLKWAVGQIEDDLDPDHQAELAACQEAIRKATGN